MHLQRGMTPEAISKTNLINIFRDMLGDILKVRSETIQYHTIVMAWHGLEQYMVEVDYNTIPAYVASYTETLREIVKAYPMVQEMIETEIRGQEWYNERQRRPDKLIQYFNSIKTLTQLESCMDGKKEVVSLKRSVGIKCRRQ